MTGIVVLALTALSARAEQVTFPSLDATPIRAHVFQPARQPPRGTVVALHGCGGVYATAGSRKGELSARHRAYAGMLTGEGYAVVFPDSLAPRGETQICTQRNGSRRITQAERRADALGAMAWVAAQPWARPDRIALLGWSNGGSAVLSATDASRRDVRAQPTRPVLAIAFYPGCGVPLKSGYRPTTRLVMLLGEKDDWTPPGPCIELGRSVDAQVHVYADSHHGFDNPVGQVRLLKEVPNGANPGQGVHSGRNPEAAQQSGDRVRELLRDAFGP
ncbi:MAG: dienelactone hydrolase family protein [Ramlibacter sp.]|nr:dienelactone hydrolase family protein [Ramlibacter sp.]